ncbi:hypothetical protein [Haloferula sp. BvORR071]|uniref:hypothetical protein n=1 Tax=Haloferula sp. BvORR071 TaxID=1396141 RepID=UPI000555A711|nr:hypothetical protein [Haloferula sp. BvORR071]
MIHNRQSRAALPELRLATRFDAILVELPWARGLSSSLPITPLHRVPPRRMTLQLTPMPALPS